MRFFKLLIFSTLLLAARQVEAQCPSTIGAINTVNDITCFGLSDGSIRLKLNTGGAPTNYELYDNNLGQTVPSNVGGVIKVIDADRFGVTFTSVYASNFSIYIYRSGCVPNPLVYSPGGGLNVNEPPDLITSPIISPDCNPATGPGNQSGSITLNVSGGNNPYTVLWNDGVTTQNRPTLDAGTYSVVVTDKNNCQISVSNLVVPGSPTITLGSIPSVCTGVTSSSLSYSATTDSPNEYRIDWTAGITDVGFTALPASPIPIIGIPVGVATYTGTLFVRNTATTCESIGYPISVTVNAIPVAPTVTSPVTYCQNATAVALTATGSNLLWYTVSSGGVGSATAPTPSTVAAGTTSYYVSQTVNGCEGPRAQIDVVVNATPVAPTVTSPVTYCLNASAVALTATGSNLLWYTVSSGGVGSATAPTPSTVAAGTTSYYVSQTVIGCEGPRAQIDVVVNALPVVSTPSASLCIGATMTASPSVGGTWVSSAPGVATITNAGLITGVSAGSVTFTFTNTATGCSNTTPSVTVNALPVVSTPSASLCIGTTMTASPSAGGTWISSAPGVATITNAGLITGVSVGAVTFTFTAAGGCSNTTPSVTIKALPVVSTPSASLCIGATMTASPSAGGTWVSSTPGVATITNAGLITGVSAGVVTFTFTDTATGCSKTTPSVTVNALPVVSTPSASLCIGATMTASPSAGGTWISSAPGVATITNAGLITGVSAGAVTFTFTNTATGCSNTTSSVTINALPVVSTPSASLCIGLTMTASPGAGGTWVSSAPGVATITNAGLITGVSAGSVTFTFTNTATGCSNTTSSVTVNALPLVSTPSASVCIGATMTASPSVGGTWVSSAPGIATITNAGLITGVSAGAVTFTFTNTATGCSNTTSSVTVNALPVVSTPSASLCIGATMTASPSAGGTWVSSAPGVATITNAGLITGVSAGAVTFTFTNSATGCSNTTSSVTVNALPVVSTPSASLCIGATMTASPSAGGTWLSSAPGIATITNAGLITGVSAGSVTFTFTDTATGCSKTTTSVTVNSLPVVSTPSASLCIGSTMTASPSAGGTWLSSAPGVATVTNAGLITGVSAGVVTFTFTDTTTGCSNTTPSVTIKALPVVSTPSPSLCIGSTMTASPGVGGTWISSSTGVATIDNAGVITGVSAGVVTFTFTDTATGCSKTTTSVTVNALPVVSTPLATLCIGSTMTASPSAGGTWISSAPGVATITNAGLVTGVSAGAVTFTFTNTATGCSNTTSSVTVNTLPVVSTPSASLCIGSTMTANPSAGGTWLSSAPGVATITNAGLIMGVSAGVVTFTFTDTATGCSNTTSSITVNALPVVSTPSASLCIGATMTAGPSAGGTWVSSAPGIATITNAGLITGVSAGSVTFTFTDTATGCSNTTSSVTVNALPVVSTPSASLCIGSTMTASPSTGGTWVSSSSGIATIDNAGLITGISAGAVTFTFTDTATSCSNTTSSVTVNPLPVVSTPSNVLCVGTTMTASPSGGGTWISSSPGVATIDNTGLITGVSSGIVSFTFTESVNSCSSTTSNVTINSLPTASVSGASTICFGSTADLQFDFTGTGPWAYQYSDGVTTFNGNSATNTALLTVSPTVTTTYTLVSVSDAFCTGTIAGPSVQIIVNTLPDNSLVLSAVPDPICIGGSSTISVANSEIGVTYQLRNNSDNSLIGSAVAGTGASLDLNTGALNTTATFNVFASNGICSIQLTSTITITVLGNIDASLPVSAQSSAICEGSVTNILVDNSVNGVNYQLRDDSDDSLIGSAVSGTGGTISLPTGVLASSKVFNVLAANGTCSIELTNTVNVNVDINPDPSLSVAAALNPLCVGGSTNVTVSASEIGVAYQLRDDSDNSLIGSAVAGTGGQIDLPTGVLNSNITFNILATGGVCTPVQLNNKVTITVSGSIDLTLATNAQTSPICAGGNTNIQIANSEVGVDYQLIDDSNNSLIPGVVTGTGGLINLPTGNLNGTTTFRVLATNASCSAELTSTSTVNVTALPSITLTVTAVSSSVCEFASTFVQVANSEPGVTYQLRNDADNSIVSGAVIGNGNTIDLPTGILTSTITFNVLATNGNCPLELSNTVTVTVNNAPIETLTVVAQDPAVCNGKSTMIQVLNTEPGIIYQLRDDADNSIVSGATFGNGSTINLPTGVLTATRTFNVLASNSQCSIKLLNTATVTLLPISDPLCSNCSSVVVSTINPVKVTCGATVPDGSITFQIEPPVPVVDIVGVKIQISGPTPKTQTNNFVFTGLAAGSYTYIVTYGDENNPACIKPGSFIIESKGVPDPIIFDVFVNEFNCRNYKGSISLQNIEGEPNTAYDFTVLNNGTPLTQGVISASSQSFTIPGLLLGDYEIQLTQNQEPANGCVGIVSSQLIDFSIVQPPGGCGLFIPNIFSPNNDGVNDSFLIRELPANSSVTITNRWGKEVYSSSNYQNNWTAENIADGIYYYRILADGEPITGWVEILR